MGQPKVASVTWRDRIRRISQGFYETMGQQIPQTRASEPMRAWSHVKILNRDLRSTVIFLRKPKGIGQTFRLQGRHWFLISRCARSAYKGTPSFRCVFRANSDSDSNLIRTLIPIHFGQRFRSKSDSDSDLNSDTFSGVPESCSKRIKLFTRSIGATLDKSAPSDLFQNEKVTNGTTQQIHASDQRNTST
jgi:hypothetical protein